jgi:hypothetical protein
MATSMIAQCCAAYWWRDVITALQVSLQVLAPVDIMRVHLERSTHGLYSLCCSDVRANDHWSRRLLRRLHHWLHAGQLLR